MIRRANSEDLPELLRMGEALCEHTGISFDPAQTFAMLMGFMNVSDRVIFVAGTHSSALNGMFLAIAARNPWDVNFVYTTDMGCWVDPAVRHQGLGRQFLEHYVAWAKKLGAKKIITAIHADHVEASHTGMTQLGFTKREQNYVIRS